MRYRIPRHPYSRLRLYFLVFKARTARTTIEREVWTLTLRYYAHTHGIQYRGWGRVAIVHRLPEAA